MIRRIQSASVARPVMFDPDAGVTLGFKFEKEIPVS
jgi:hypothetical protein